MQSSGSEGWTRSTGSSRDVLLRLPGLGRPEYCGWWYFEIPLIGKFSICFLIINKNWVYKINTNWIVIKIILYLWHQNLLETNDHIPFVSCRKVVRNFKFIILTNWIGVPDKSFTISNNLLIYKIINKFYKQI